MEMSRLDIYLCIDSRPKKNLINDKWQLVNNGKHAVSDQVHFCQSRNSNNRINRPTKKTIELYS